MYYKFRNCNKNNFKALEEGCAYFSSFKELNDPFDGSFMQEEKIGDNLSKKLDRRLIYCMTEGNNEGAVTLNHLMWTFYACAHRGFCIEYNDLIFEGFKSYDMVKNIQEHVWMKIVYTHACSDQNRCGDNEENFFARALKHKAKAFEFENEIRLIYHTDKPGGRCMQLTTGCINAIYLGCRISKDNKEKLIKIAKAKSIACYQMIMDKTSYILGVEQVWPSPNMTN